MQKLKSLVGYLWKAIARFGCAIEESFEIYLYGMLMLCCSSYREVRIISLTPFVFVNVSILNSEQLPFIKSVSIGILVVYLL